MSSDSDSSGDERKLPAAYANRLRRRRDSSSCSPPPKPQDDRRRERRSMRKEDVRRKNPRRKEKKDRPMWKEEGEISCESDTESSSSSTSYSSRSRSRSRDRRSRRRRHSDDRERSRRRESVPEKMFKCDECGCSHFSLKALIHHNLHDHSLGAQCHLCQKKFDTTKDIREHYELDHTQEVVKCNFCKCSFDQPLEMRDPKWEEFFTHLYGEIFYSRLAENEERAVG